MLSIHLIIRHFDVDTTLEQNTILFEVDKLNLIIIIINQ
jgi:hypothetical protein